MAAWKAAECQPVWTGRGAAGDTPPSASDAASVRLARANGAGDLWAMDSTSPTPTLTSRPGLPFVVIGIDPGFSGALAAVVFRGAEKPRVFMYRDMPLANQLDGRALVDPIAVAAWIRGVQAYAASTTPGAQVRCAIEKVSASPQMGVVSAFRFGQGYGAVSAVAATSGLLMHHVAPSVWKPAMGLSSDKGLSLALARQTFSAPADAFRLAKHDGRAEASLLAAFIGNRFLAD